MKSLSVEQQIRTALTNVNNWTAMGEGWEGRNYNHHFDFEIEMSDEDKKEIFVAAYTQRKAKWFNNKTQELVEFDCCEVQVEESRIYLFWECDAGLDLESNYRNSDRLRHFLYFDIDSVEGMDWCSYEMFEKVACEMFGIEIPDFLEAVNA